MLVPARVAQRRYVWPYLSVDIFLPVAAAHQRRQDYLKPQHSEHWVEVLQQTRDLNSISGALKELNT